MNSRSRKCGRNEKVREQHNPLPARIHGWLCSPHGRHFLRAERTVLQAEDAVAQAETAPNTDVLAIYKALGGG